MAERQAQSGSNSTAIIFAVFAVACVAVFLAFRGSDIGQLPKLLGNLGGGPLFGPGIADSLAGVGVATLIAVSWFGLGSAITRYLIPAVRTGRLMDVARRMAIGAGVWSLIWFFLGLGAGHREGAGVGAGFLSFIWFYINVAGLYSAPIALATTFIGIILAGFALLRRQAAADEDAADKKRTILDNGLVFLIGSVLALTLIGSLAPPTAKDTLLYHFAVPKAFIAQGGSAVIDGNIASYLALGTEMHAVWAMLLGNLISSRAGEAAAGMTTFIFFPMLLAVVFGWARELGVSRPLSLLATAIVATIPSVYHVASSGYIDVSLTLFVTLAAYALSRWWEDQVPGVAVLIAMFLGAALSIKLTAVFVVAAFALIILMRARSAENPGKVFGLGFAALLFAGLIASPWYIRTWAASGSPVFPFYMSVLNANANGWDKERSDLFQGMTSQYGGTNENKLNYLTSPIRLSLNAQPEVPANYDGVLGVAFLIGLPLLILALWKYDVPVDVKIGAGVAGVVYLFWLFSSEQLRYLLPIMPLLAIAIAASLDLVAKASLPVKAFAQYSLSAAAVCGLLTIGAWFCQRAPLRVVLGGETRDEYLARNLDYFSYYHSINSNTAPGAKVWLINTRRDTYNIERPVFSDYIFEDWTLRKMVWAARSVEELRAKAATLNVQYVLARHDFLFDYDRSTLVDDKRPRAENEAKLIMAKSFLLDPTRTVRADDKFSLIKVF